MAIEIIMVALVWSFTDPFISVFNSENNQLLLEYAHVGLRLYFLGFLFAGVNIVLVAYFSATAIARPAIIGSLLRGVVAIGICAIVLSRIFGMNGVWLSFLTSEVITLIMVLILARHKESRKTMHTFDILLQQIGAVYNLYSGRGDPCQNKGAES